VRISKALVATSLKFGIQLTILGRGGVDRHQWGLGVFSGFGSSLGFLGGLLLGGLFLGTGLLGGLFLGTGLLLGGLLLGGLLLGGGLLGGGLFLGGLLLDGLFLGSLLLHNLGLLGLQGLLGGGLGGVREFEALLDLDKLTAGNALLDGGTKRALEGIEADVLVVLEDVLLKGRARCTASGLEPEDSVRDHCVVRSGHVVVFVTRLCFH
jgi:hypothetical protein